MNEKAFDIMEGLQIRVINRNQAAQAEEAGEDEVPEELAQPDEVEEAEVDSPAFEAEEAETDKLIPEAEASELTE